MQERGDGIWNRDGSLAREVDEAETPRGQWARGEVTRAVRADIQKLVDSAIHALHCACEQTTDGRVADAYGRMKGAQASLLLFEPKRKS